MGNIRARIASMKGLAQLLESDPQLRTRFEAEQETLEETNGRDPMSVTAARLRSIDSRIGGVYRNAGSRPTKRERRSNSACRFGRSNDDGNTGEGGPAGETRRRKRTEVTA
jgi:hypothetical protein